MAKISQIGNGSCELALVLFERSVIKSVRQAEDTYLFGDNFKDNVPSSSARLTLWFLELVTYSANKNNISLQIFDGLHDSIHDSLKRTKPKFILPICLASKTSIEFIKYILSGKSVNIESVIWGTEVSFDNEFRKGTFSELELEKIYTKSSILRHTARTETALLSMPWTSKSRQFEFSLSTNGIENKLPSNNSYREAKVVMVLGPEGRKTKNNLGTIAAVRSISHNLELEVVVFKPPYNVKNLWAELLTAKYCVFLSEGETFSYVYHDAIVLGALTIRLQKLFEMHQDVARETIVVGSVIGCEPATSSIDGVNEILSSLEHDTVRRRELLEIQKAYIDRLTGLAANSERLLAIMNKRPLECGVAEVSLFGGDIKLKNENDEVVYAASSHSLAAVNGLLLSLRSLHIGDVSIIAGPENTVEEVIHKIGTFQELRYHSITQVNRTP
ncbi:MAG: hypothetical protein ABJK39_14455 [Hyphomicrobiales bacterium]